MILCFEHTHLEDLFSEKVHEYMQTENSIMQVNYQTYRTMDIQIFIEMAHNYTLVQINCRDTNCPVQKNAFSQVQACNPTPCAHTCILTYTRTHAHS